jgi:hypothetical protein
VAGNEVQCGQLDFPEEIAYDSRPHEVDSGLDFYAGSAIKMLGRRAVDKAHDLLEVAGDLVEGYAPINANPHSPRYFRTRLGNISRPRPLRYVSRLIDEAHIAMGGDIDRS